MAIENSICVLDSVQHQDGVWHVYATITTPQGTRCGPHQIKGDPEMTDAAIKAAILALYN